MRDSVSQATSSGSQNTQGLSCWMDRRRALRIRSCARPSSKRPRMASGAGAHGALAAVWAELHGGVDEARAWHLSESTTGPDEAVASIVEGSAMNASARGSVADAVRGLSRAAALSPSVEQRASRLFLAGFAATMGGLPADALLAEAASAAKGRARSEAIVLRVLAAAGRGEHDAVERLVAEARPELAAGHPDLEAVLVNLGTSVSWARFEIEPCAERCREAWELAGRQIPTGDLPSTSCEVGCCRVRLDTEVGRC